MAEKTAVVMMQLGGPDSRESVEPFLYNLFCDPDIIDFPGAFFARKWLARTISSRRWKPVAEHYAHIGGKSPILDLTVRQANALQTNLRSHGIDATTIVAMRYWHPMTEAAVRQVRDGGFDRVLLLPLYPQLSRATTVSSVNEWRRQASIHGLDLPTDLICCYPAHPLFILALTEQIRNSLEAFHGIAPEEIDLIFSAHGVPVSYIKKGDPYQMHVEETVRQVCHLGAWTSPTTLCYQSKVGPQQWLQPSLHDTIITMGARGRKNLLVVPVAFVTDHIETLYEINIEERETAMHAGIVRFEMTPGLNDHPLFIDCLTDLVAGRLRDASPSGTVCEALAAGREYPSVCPVNQNRATR